MKFIRGIDPKRGMEIGLRTTSPIIYRLLIEDQSMVESFGGSPPKNSYVTGVPRDKTEKILRNIKDYPQSVHNYYVEFMDKGGMIYSGLSPLSNYAGKVVQYKGEFYQIPKV